MPEALRLSPEAGGLCWDGHRKTILHAARLPTRLLPKLKPRGHPIGHFRTTQLARGCQGAWDREDIVSPLDG